jgi:hypothetical protein
VGACQKQTLRKITDPTNGNSYDYEDGEDPTSQLLAEYRTFNSSVQIPATDDMYAPPHANFQANNEDDPYTFSNAPTFPPITPPQSTEDTSHVRGHKRTRRSARAADPVKGSRDKEKLPR